MPKGFTYYFNSAKLLSLRREAGLSTKQVAHICGLSVQGLRAAENPDTLTATNAKMVRDLATLYGVKENTLRITKAGQYKAARRYGKESQQS